ncbi:hypothetical protein SprV_0100027200 [Sparganum proliferum]
MAKSAGLRNMFYEDLHAILVDTLRPDKPTAPGVFSARVRTDHAVWKEVLGLHGIGVCNDNDLIPLRTCSELPPSDAEQGNLDAFLGQTTDLAIETVELLLRSKYNETENRLGHAQVLQLLKFCLKT